jgi:hypothetical protein
MGIIRDRPHLPPRLGAESQHPSHDEAEKYA